MSHAWVCTVDPSGLSLGAHRLGVGWIVPRAAELVQRWGGRLTVRASGTAGFLIPALEKARVPVDSVTRRFYADACPSSTPASPRTNRHNRAH